MPSDFTDEREAYEVRARGVLARVVRTLQSARAVLKNPADTRKLFYLAAMLHDGAVFARRFVAAPGGRALMDEQPSIDSDAVDFGILAQLPIGTLGRELADFLTRHRLSADIFQGPPELPRDEAYAVKRYRQTHDLWHVLAGYGTDSPGEVALQAFSFAQTGARSAGVMTVMFTLRHLRHRPIVRAALEGYRAGRRAAPLIGVRWEDLWAVPLDELRRRYRLSD